MPHNTPPSSAAHDLPDLARYEDGYRHAHGEGRNLLANFAHAVGLHPPAVGGRSRARYGGKDPLPPHGTHRRSPAAPDPPLHTPRRAFAPLVRPDRALFDTLEGQGNRIPLHPGTTITTRDHRSGVGKEHILRAIHRELAVNRGEQQLLHSKRHELETDPGLDLFVSEDYLVDIDLALLELRSIERSLLHEIDMIIGRAGTPPRKLLPYYSYQADDDHFPDDEAEKLLFLADAYDQRADNLRYNMMQKIHMVAQKGLSIQWGKVMQDIDDIQRQFARETTIIHDERERKRQIRLHFERVIEDPRSYYANGYIPGSVLL